jgi:hypothetical protein
MKKILLFSALVCSLNVFSQGYWNYQTKGITDAYNQFQATASTSIIFDKGTNDVLSGANTIPFPFSFNGNSYSSYKVCDNGYLTFDLTATTAQKTPKTLPDSTAPKNAIFALWSDMECIGNTQYTSERSQVFSYSYGSSPNRVHVVQWYGMAKKGVTPDGSNIIFMAIKLYEAGGFDIIYGGKAGSISGLAGYQNSDGTMGSMIGGNASFAYPIPATALTILANADMIVYKHVAGIQPNYDAALTKLIIDPVVKKATNITLKGNLANYGKNDLSSLDVYYTIDSGTKVKGTLSTLNTTNSGGVETFDFPTPLNFTTSGYKVIKAWTEKPNLRPDENNLNDTLTVNIFVNEGIAGTKRVLLEEGSGGWCGYCPDGHLRMRDILASNNKVVAVVHHNGDGMVNTQSSLINTAYATGYPYGVVDRTLYTDQTTVGLNRGLWDAKATENLNAITPVNISIVNKTYNAATRTLSYTVKADFVDDALPGDMRITSIISEDNVRGPMISPTSTTWSQHNYYSSMDASAGGSAHEFYNEPAYFYGYNHRHVAKTILPSAWGNAGVIPNAPLKGSSYTQNFTYTLPAVVSVSATDFPSNTGIYTPFQNTYPGEANNKIGATSIIGLVSYYNTDVTKCKVINVNETPALWSTSAKEEFKSAYFSNVFPNPTTGITQIDFKLSSTDNLTIELFDIMGKSVKTIKNGSFASGDHSIFFDTENIENGVYFLKLSSTNYTATHKLAIQK